MSEHVFFVHGDYRVSIDHYDDGTTEVVYDKVREIHEQDEDDETPPA